MIRIQRPDDRRVAMGMEERISQDQDRDDRLRGSCSVEEVLIAPRHPWQNP
jgi:hypothetical protein